MSNTVCLKCGGTGVTFDNKPCDCGSKPQNIEKINDIDKYIPLLYQNSELLGVNQVLTNIRTITLKDVIDRYIKEKEKSISLLIDVSNTSEGAYNIYYNIVERLIKDNDGVMPKDFVNNIMVNQISIPDLERIENDVFKGKWIPLIIITEYPLDRYENIRNYIKLLQFNRYPNKIYPLNVYHMIFMDKGRG